MWCAQKFVSGHQCVRSQLYQLLVEDGEELLHDMDQNMGTGEITETIAGNEAEEGLKPVISLHALLGTGDSQTMRLQGKIKTFTVVILVDSGSTHNFIDQGVVKRGGLHTQTINGLSVSVANGAQMWVQDMCPGVLWRAGDVTQQIDCFVLPLKGCDMVLGVQWLRSLGPIIWDFTTLTMQFTVDNQKMTLHGIVAGGVSMATKKQSAKYGTSATSTCTLLLTSVMTQTSKGCDVE